MELLVLSSLEWKMNPVTPLSFIDYIMRRLGLISHYRYSELVRRSERLLLAVINGKLVNMLPVYYELHVSMFVIHWHVLVVMIDNHSLM